MWKWLRVFILLVVFATVAKQTLMDKADLDWKDNFYVTVYPVNADGSVQVTQYVQQLKADDFEPMEEFFATEAAKYNVGLRRPVEVQLGDVVQKIPPAPPKNGGFIPVIAWSLKFRWFTWNNSPKTSVKPDIRLYLLYYDPETSPSLSHSTALNKGRVGRINLFGNQSYNNQNLVIVAHELLHTVNASDKYDLTTNLPSYPDGFAEPDLKPLYPQSLAELMGGRTPLSQTEALTPKSLNSVIVGNKTAREIGWIK